MFKKLRRIYKSPSLVGKTLPILGCNALFSRLTGLSPFILNLPQ